MNDSVAPSDAEVLARAAWLVGWNVTTQFPEGEQRRLEHALRSHAQVDDSVARAVVTVMLSDLQRLPIVDRFLDALDTVVCASLTRTAGRVVVKSRPLAPRLFSLVDYYALAALDDRGMGSLDGPRWGIESLRPESIEVQRVLSRTSLESHVHLGGMLPALFFWIRLMSGSIDFGVLRSLSAASGCAIDAWPKAAKRAALLRLQIAAAIKDSDVFPHVPPEAWKLLLGEDDAKNDDADNDDADKGAARKDHIELLTARELLAAFSRAVGTLGAKDPLCVDQARDGAAGGEARLLRAAVTFLRSLDDTKRQAASELGEHLLEYIRLRNAFHVALLHPGGSAGLARFAESFEKRTFGFKHRERDDWNHRRRRRHRRQRLELEQLRMHEALNEQLRDAYGSDKPEFDTTSRGIEVRVSLERGPLALRVIGALLHGVRDYLRGLGPLPPPHRVGFVVHAVRGKQPERVATRALEDAKALAWILAGYPELRRYFVGFDVAGPERDSPPRLFGPTFQLLRDLNNGYRSQPGEPPLQLGLTYHAGEDYWDILTGIRHVSEVVDLLFAGQPGRLGHALALAIPPAEYYARRGRTVEVPINTHLLDLVWALGTLQAAGEANAAGLAESRLQKLCASLCITPEPEECWRAMHGRPGAEVPSEEALLRRLNSAHARRSDQFFTLRPDADWLCVVQTAQRVLQQQVARKTICVEANPTSNLLVGGFSDYDELPYQHLVRANIPVSLNTDDPGLFTTSLPLEIEHVRDALSRTPGSSGALPPTREVSDWLDGRIRDAERHSFLGPAVPEGRIALQHLSETTLLLYHSPTIALGKLFPPHRR